MKKFAILLLLLVGCSKVEDQMVAGAYAGFFGNEDSQKVGVECIITQTGNQISGEPTISWSNQRQQSWSYKCKLEGTVKGDQVKLKIHGVEEPLEVEVDAVHTSKEGYFALVGDGKIDSGTSKAADAIRRVMRDGKLHFQIKTEAAVTEKKN